MCHTSDYDHYFYKLAITNRLSTMKKKLLIGLIIANALLWSTAAYADKSAFCTGFSEGYKTIKGNMVIVPICPIRPITPIGSTDFREGIKAGMRAAKRGI